MNIKVLILILFSFTSSFSWANLYHCDNHKSRPRFSKEESISTISYETVKPTIWDYATAAEFHNNKKPFLIYYTIDSEEAFMQYSVRYEVAKLEESCKRSGNVNFVGILNSLYLNKNEIIICKNKELQYLNLSSNPSFDSALKFKKKFISSGNHLLEDLGPLIYRVRYPIDANKPFGKYPLAHPDFLHDLIDFVLTEKTLFPREDYIPFLNLKSHGSSQLVLAGMHDCQSKAKVLSAKKVIEKVLKKNEIKFLEKQKSSNDVLSNLDKFENLLDKIQLGPLSSGSSQDDIQATHLGNTRLDLRGNGLGEAISGLGVNEGLGVGFGFGTYHIHLNWVLSDLFDDYESNRALGFLMLESCDTKREAELFHTYLKNVLGFYSAKHSLWYRNLDWWSMLEEAENSSIKLLNILKKETAKIPNIKVD